MTLQDLAYLCLAVFSIICAAGILREQYYKWLDRRNTRQYKIDVYNAWLESHGNTVLIWNPAELKKEFARMDAERLEKNPYTEA